MDQHIEQLKKAAIEAVMALREATGATAFVLPVPDTSPQLYVAMGSAERIRTNLEQAVRSIGPS